MRDGEVGTAIAVGDPGGLAEAYDKYAPALYTYCGSLLGSPDDAADAVQDTFVIAASELAGLHDRRRLRPWLFAVARNECLRRTGGLVDAAPSLTDASVDSAELADLGAPLRSAVRGLGGGERDLIQLRWQQGLDVAEIAAIMGVSRNRAHALLTRAQDQLENALGALLVARTGGYDCGELDGLLADGELTASMRKRIDRHIRKCFVCGERRRRELAPALMFGLAPLGAPPVATMPEGLRDRVLTLANSGTPGAVAYRAGVARRTAPFRNHGFPRPIDPPGRQWRPSRQRQAAAAAGVAIAGAVAAATLLTLALASGGPAPGRHAGAALSGRPGPAAGTSASSGVVTGVSGVTGSARPGRHRRAAPTVTVTVAVGGLAPTVGSPGGGAASGSRPSTSRPSTSRPRSGRTPSGRSATVAVTATPTPVRGTLAVTPRSITPLPGRSATLILTASGGPVSWSITLPQSLVGELTVQPSSGTLAAGASVTVTVVPGGMLIAGGVLTLEPGGIAVTVVPYL